MNKLNLSRKIWIWDYIVVPVLIIFVLYQPNFIHGYINIYEAGKELSCVNELLRGKVLYRDIFTPFGPLNIYFQMLPMILFGKHLALLRWYFYIGNILVLITAYLIGRCLSRNRFFSFAMALILVVDTYHPFWATRWGGFRFLFGLLAVLCTAYFFKKEKGLWSFFAGIFTAVAFLTSFDVGILALIAISITLGIYIGLNIIRDKIFSFRPPILFIIGNLAIFIPFLIYFVVKGAFLPYVTTLVTLAKNHTSTWISKDIDIFRTISSGKIFTYNFQFIIYNIFYISMGIFLAFRVIERRTYNWKDYSKLCLCSYGWLMVIIKASSERLVIGPQFQMAIQPAIILIFIFLEDIFRLMAKSIRHIKEDHNFIKLVTLVFVFVSILSYIIFSEKRLYEDFKNWFIYQKHKSNVFIMPAYTREEYQANVKLSRLRTPRAKGIITISGQAEVIDNVTRYISAVTKPDEPIFTFPEHGLYNFLTDRPSISRFAIAGLAWTTHKWRKELLADLKRKRPKYIIYDNKLSNLARVLKRKEKLLPKIREYIHSHYKEEVSFGSVDILRRIDFLEHS